MTKTLRELIHSLGQVYDDSHIAFTRGKDGTWRAIPGFTMGDILHHDTLYDVDLILEVIVRNGAKLPEGTTWMELMFSDKFNNSHRWAEVKQLDFHPHDSKPFLSTHPTFGWDVAVKFGFIDKRLGYDHFRNLLGCEIVVQYAKGPETRYIHDVRFDQVSDYYIVDNKGGEHLLAVPQYLDADGNLLDFETWNMRVNGLF